MCLNDEKLWFVCHKRTVYRVEAVHQRLYGYTSAISTEYRVVCTAGQYT